MDAEETVAPDRISELPELVLHYILSFLPVKDAARTSILSKRWCSMWDTLPCLNFGEGFFLNPDIVSAKERLNFRQMKKNKILLDIADRIILRRRQQNASIEELCFTIPEHKFSKRQKFRQNVLYYKLKRWMSFVAKSSLKELDLINHVNGVVYLPRSIVSAKSLTVLSLCGFSLMTLSSLDIKFPSLRKLLLSAVYLDDHIMGNLIIGCPLLENLRLNSCYVLKTIYVTGLLKLKLLEVRNIWDLKILEIDAPELLDLNLLGLSAERRFNVKTCARLRKLWLGGEFITEKWLHHFVSQCLFLEDLIIFCSSKLENLKISSDTLKTLVLGTSQNLVEVEITAPSLEKVTFQVKVNTLPTVLLNASDMLEVEFAFYSWEVDLGHDELAKFLGYFNRFKTVTFHDLQDEVIIPKEKRDSLFSPLCDARNLVFFVDRMKIATVELVEYMLWLSPRAETVLIRNFPYKYITNAFLKFVYDNENDHEGLSSPCCKFLPTKCWRHCLAEVRVEKFGGNENEMTKMKNFFLEHAKNLKIVDTSPSSDSFCDGLYTFYDELFLDKDE